MSQKITPFLWFDNQAEEAANFYTTLFTDSALGQVSRYGPDTPGPAGQVMTVRFKLAGLWFTALNGGPYFNFTPAHSFFVHNETEQQVDTLWQALSAGGSVLMDLAAYPFSEKFGWVQDRFGLSWQVSLDRVPQSISPFFMFTGAQHGRAAEAVHLYTSLFPASGVDRLDLYGPGEDGPEGTTRHAAFRLAGQPFEAIDSAFDHGFTFTPAISFYIDCRDQAEVDFFWDRLLDGGQPSQCGWLTDRFGVSWQVIPTALIELMNDPDPQKSYRVTQAMLKMVKIDIAALKQAYNQ